MQRGRQRSDRTVRRRWNRLFEDLESRLLLTAQSGSDAPIDTTPPVITAVYINGTNWTSAYRNYLQANGKGSSTLGYLMPTGVGQAHILGYGNINTISLVFSENVVASIGDFTVTGINNPSYTISGFTLNGNVATWTLSQSIPDDLIQLHLSDNVTDLAGNRLDGEWQNAVSTVSGNGVAGGDFNYDLTILPGDANGDGIVDLTDMTILATAWQKPFNGTDSLADFSGDLNVDLTDLTILSGDWNVKAPKLEVSSITTNPSAATPTNHNTVTYTFTFNRDVTGVDLTDFSLNTIGLTGAAITGLTGSGSVYNVTVNTGTGTGSATVTLVDNDSIHDLAGYALGGDGAGNGTAVGPTLMIDRTPPTITSITTTANSPTNSNALIYTVNFSEPVLGVDLSDFTLATTGLTGAAITDLNGGNSSYLVTVQPGTGVGTLTLKTAPGATITDLALNPFNSSYSAAPMSVDTISPVITGVYVDSSQWSTAFLNYLAAHGLGSTAYGYEMPTGANQLRTLPWTGLNNISIQFSKNVVVTQNSLSITGVNLASYSITAFHYDSTNHVATWTLASPISADKLLLDMPSGTVRDAANNPLDGEWVDGVSTVSGNGGTGGNFNYRLNVLPGDVDGNSTVQSQDDSTVQAFVPSNTASPGYQIVDDLNGDGSINATDVSAVNSNLSKSLPAANPIAPSASLITDEMFGNQTTWNQFSPGGLGTITTGSVTRILMGASTVGGDPRGWSGYIDSAFNSYNSTNQSITDTDPDGYLYGWFKFTSFDLGAGSTALSTLAEFVTSETDRPNIGGLGCDLVVEGNGSIGLATNSGLVLGGSKLALNTWYRIAVQWTAGSNYSFNLLVGTQSSPLTQVVSVTSAGMTRVNYVGLHNDSYGNGGVGAGFLVSAYHVYESAPLFGVSDPAGVTAPEVGPFTFYIRSDAVGSGDGSADTPQSALTWDEAALYAPLISAAPDHNFNFTSSGLPVDPTAYSATTLRNMFLAGQVTYAGDHWLLGTDIVGVDTNLTVNGELGSVGNNHFTVSGMVTLNPAVATQYDPTNYPNVWVMPSTSQTALFEDGNWMHAAEGTSITSPGTESADSYSSVAAAVNAVPGTFYNDGSYFYFSTFDSAAPTAHTYQRSSDISSTSLTSLAIVDGYLHDLTFEGTVLVDPTGLPTQSYAFMVPDSDWTVVNNVATALTGFHAAGSLDDGSNGRLTVMNLTLGPSAPSRNKYDNPFWYDWGGQIPWVSFNGVATATGNQTDLYNISIPYTDALVGTATGFANPDTPAIYSHNGGTGVQYSEISVVNANVGGEVGFGNNVADAALQNVTATSFVVYDGTGDNLKTTYGAIIGSGGNFVVTHSLVTGVAWMSLNNQGGISFNYCTIDMSNFYDATSDFMPVFNNAGTGTTSIHNSIIIGDQHTIYQLEIYARYSPSTLSADYNLYVQNVGPAMFAYQYDNGTTVQNISTFQQWQAISGQDAHSKLISSVAALGLDANYVPQTGSPAIGASSDGLAIGAFQPGAPMTPQFGSDAVAPATTLSTTTTSASPAVAPLTQQSTVLPTPATDPLKTKAKSFRKIRH